MVLLDLKMVQTLGLSSRQASLVGAGDFRREKSRIKSTLQDSDQEDDPLNNQATDPSLSRSSSTLSRAVRKASHLYLQDKNITKISPQISKLKNLKVLYLYDNKLKSAETLYYASNLTHVYLMNNGLTSTKGFSKLKNLEKLYLASNKIEVVEDLLANPLEQEYDPKLKELHLENQILPAGHSLIFDPQCLANLAYSLRVLNISKNNVTSVDAILETCHKSLDKFYASDNQIKTLSLDSHAPSHIGKKDLDFPYLSVVHLKGNPIQKKMGSKKYRQKLVVKFRNLKDLDNHEISTFERRWHESFSLQLQKRADLKAKNSKSLSEEASAHDPSYSFTQQAQEAALAADPMNITRQDSTINFGTESADNLLSQKLSSLSAMDLAPPVPEHWRKKGLPGGRNQFDKILEKARLQAHERILSQTTKKHLNLQEANRKLAEMKVADAGDHSHSLIQNTKRDFQNKLGGSGEFGDADKNRQEDVLNEEREIERKILNLSAMKLAPDYNMHGDN